MLSLFQKRAPKAEIDLCKEESTAHVVYPLHGIYLQQQKSRKSPVLYFKKQQNNIQKQVNKGEKTCINEMWW